MNPVPFVPLHFITISRYRKGDTIKKYDHVINKPMWNIVKYETGDGIINKRNIETYLINDRSGDRRSISMERRSARRK